jgi:dihydrofolate reductase
LARLRFRIAISLDGYTAGPEQSVENPLGIGGTRLHEWALPLEAWRKPHGLKGGKVNQSTPVMEGLLSNLGSTIMGRNMFGGHPGGWDRENPWNGWWGEDPPFHHPVFVLTHHPRPPLTLKGGTSFTFVTDGIRSAYDQAIRAAKGRDVALAGGANVARQYLNAGLVHEMVLHVVPTLLGLGDRLFDGVTDLKGLRPVQTVAAPDVTHLKFARG